MGRITINGTMSQFSYKLTVRSTLWDAKAKKASGRSLEAQRLNEKLENIKTNIGKLYQRLCDRDLYVTAERFATPFWVWAMTAVFCCKPSTNTLQASSNVWAKTAPIPPMRITACGAGVLQLCTNTNTMSRTFRSKS